MTVTRKCDHCERYASPGYQNWMHVEFLDEYRTLDRGEGFDVCSYKCLAEIGLKYSQQGVVKP